jgi:type I restriction enzyme S subunit
MSFPRYERYKDSGVEWLGQVPEHWKVGRVKRLADKIGSGKTPLGGSEVYAAQGVLFLRSQNVYDDGLRLDEAVYIAPEVDEEMENTRVKPGDILLNVTGASIGRTCIVPTPFPSANVNQHVCIIRISKRNFREYAAMALKSGVTKAQIDLAQNGAARDGLNFDQIGNLIFAMPIAGDESAAIVRFLERELVQVDMLIEEQRRLIDLLKEKRQAVISHAVTKGLNPDAPMRPSGVEWLGDVPRTWKMKRLHILFRPEKRQNHSDKQVLSVYRDYGVVLKDSRDDNMNKTPEDVSAYQLVNRHDLVVNKMKAWQGSLGISDFEGITSHD